MKFILLISLQWVASSCLHAQQDTICQKIGTSVSSMDTVLRRYLVCETRWAVKPSVIFRDWDRVEITDTMGEKSLGTLKVLSSELLELEAENGRRDTIHISAVYLIKSESKKIQSISESMKILRLTGTILLTLYFPPAGIAIYCMYCRPGRQRQFRHWDYEFKIVQTEGFELTKKHLKNL